MDSTVISVKNISKSFGKIIALNNVSFDIKRGEIFGYLGPNGAGKTTTIRILLGLLKPSKGYFKILGHDGRDLPFERIGFVLESDGLFERLTAYQNLLFYGKIYRIEKVEERVLEYLEKFSLPNNRQRVGTFSKGMKRRLALAKALLHKPEILILDEPTSGLDPLGQMEIQEMIYEISKKDNVTVLLSSHNLEEVKKICDSVSIINKGEIVFRGDLKEILIKGNSLEEIYRYYIGGEK